MAKKTTNDVDVFSKNVLLGALEAVKPGLADKEIEEQLTHFAFTGDDLITYNDFVVVIYPFSTGFRCSVPAKHFYDIVKNMPAGDISVEMKDKKLVLKSGKTKATAKTQEGDDITKKIDDIGVLKVFNDMKELPKDFVEGVGLCLFSASKDMNDPKLTGLLVDGDTISSTDDLRCSHFTMEKGKMDRFNIPAEAAKYLVRYPVVDYVKTKRWVFFQTLDGLVFGAKLLDHDKYPNLKDLLDFDGVSIELPEKLVDAINVAFVVASGETEAERLIEIEIRGDQITCRGENENGTVDSSIDASLALVREIKFQINPGFLLQIMKHTKNMVYTEGKAKFSTGNFVHALAARG